MPGVHQPDPPGLIHDDLRLLPPWRGSSLFWGFLRIPDKFFVFGSCGMRFSPQTYPVVCQVVPSLVFIHRCLGGGGVPSSRGRRLTS
jgi:hypothetical protein